ncbi:RNA polymerase sigma factor [Dyadobacter sp. CY345]|uniref:RNA polymerase sigma factor n=1 Tax=Dyadobacter sp. CY345 TaxID=2909335 RepID=UPI001F201EFD|nr:RNA polymerase sigma factor [Dyadobacter sp. CY345]MCF2443341.1 RNA polymerase sigma factor [Dyadobacter sp. CY345]
MIRDSQQDIEIWDAFRLGDKSAYAQIYELHFDALYSYGKKFLIDETRVEDAIQDLFMTLWRTREKLSSVDNIKFYLFRSLRRDIHRLSKKGKPFEQVDFDLFLDMENHPAAEFGTSDNDIELTQRLTIILKDLPKRKLEAITLRYYENFSIEEIAVIMQVSDKTVRNTLHNSLILLRKNSNLFYTLIKATLVYLWY